jgi:hypothetical protein
MESVPYENVECNFSQWRNGKCSQALRALQWSAGELSLDCRSSLISAKSTTCFVIPGPPCSIGGGTRDRFRPAAKPIPGSTLRVAPE